MPLNPHYLDVKRRKRKLAKYEWERELELVRALESCGKNRKACAKLRNLIRNLSPPEPILPTLYISLAKIHRNLNDLDKAKIALRKALAADPRKEAKRTAHIMLACCAQELGDLQEAIHEFETYLDMGCPSCKERAEILSIISSCCEELGQFRKAKALLHQSSSICFEQPKLI